MRGFRSALGSLEFTEIVTPKLVGTATESGANVFAVDYFGQPAYLAIGAYAAAFYFYYFGTNPYVGILIGIAAGIVMSLAVGPMFVRLRSDYFALVNLALAVIVFYLMQKVLADITHADNGLWFLTNLSSTPVLDLTRPDRFFIFAFLVGWVPLKLGLRQLGKIEV